MIQMSFRIGYMRVINDDLVDFDIKNEGIDLKSSGWGYRDDDCPRTWTCSSEGRYGSDVESFSRTCTTSDLDWHSLSVTLIVRSKFYPVESKTGNLPALRENPEVRDVEEDESGADGEVFFRRLESEVTKVIFLPMALKEQVASVADQILSG